MIIFNRILSGYLMPKNCATSIYHALIKHAQHLTIVLSHFAANIFNFLHWHCRLQRSTAFFTPHDVQIDKTLWVHVFSCILVSSPSIEKRNVFNVKWRDQISNFSSFASRNKKRAIQQLVCC